MTNFPMVLQRDDGVGLDRSGALTRVLFLDYGNLWIFQPHIDLFCMDGYASNGMLQAFMNVIKTRRRYS
jgi:hypothetical protein